MPNKIIIQTINNGYGIQTYDKPLYLLYFNRTISKKKNINVNHKLIDILANNNAKFVITFVSFIVSGFLFSGNGKHING